ncbi:hypothetical protein [Caballeronia choica]|uniref:hypothetical protein n=1 Tax=Caballeronia choica TaxID=326476 RepID=UPI000F73583E|nr:hypothetical protein [Caballeronia choica]
MDASISVDIGADNFSAVEDAGVAKDPGFTSRRESRHSRHGQDCARSEHSRLNPRPLHPRNLERLNAIEGDAGVFDLVILKQLLFLVPRRNLWVI